MRFVLVAVPIFLLAMFLSLWVSGRIRQQLESTVDHHLSEAIDYRLGELRWWERQELERALSWSQHPGVAEPIARLVESVRGLSPEDPMLSAKLQEASCCEGLRAQLNQLAGRPVKFAVWDRRMLTLVDWSQPDRPELLGAPATTVGAQMLAPVLQGRGRLFLPKLNAAITEGFRGESARPVISILVPVLDSESGAVVAAIMFRDYGLEEEFDAMLRRWGGESRGEVYLVNHRGALLTDSLYGQQLETLPLAFDQTRSHALPLLRDPGADLLSGERPAQDAAAWPPPLGRRRCWPAK